MGAVIRSHDVQVCGHCGRLLKDVWFGRRVSYCSGACAMAARRARLKAVCPPVAPVAKKTPAAVSRAVDLSAEDIEARIAAIERAKKYHRTHELDPWAGYRASIAWD